MGNNDFLERHYDVQKKAKQVSRVEGKHYTEYVETVKELKREKKHIEAIDLLIKLVKAVEAEAKINRNNGRADWFVAPWYYEQMAIIYRKEKRYYTEINILERHQEKNNGKGSIKLAERLEKAYMLRDKK